MKNKTIIAAFIVVLLSPSTALAFMDTPTLGATFLTILALLIPMVFFEMRVLSRIQGGTSFRTARACAIAGVIAAVAMFALGRIQMAFVYYMQAYTGFGLYGVSSLEEIRPTALDVIFNCTIGSHRLIFREGFFPLNLVVIAVFLIPTIVVYYLSSRYFVGVLIDSKKRPEFLRTLACTKAIEYVLLIAASYLFAMWVY